MKKYLFLLLSSWLAFAGTVAAQLPLEQEANQEAVLDALQVKRTRAHLNGPDAALRNFRLRLDRGEDAAAGFVGDSTFINAGAVPTSFATALAARYPTHRVELWKAANDMSSITRTVVQAGPSGQRYVSFPTGTVQGCFMALNMARTSLNAAAAIRIDAGISFGVGKLNGSGWPTNQTQFTGWASDGNRTLFYMNTDGVLHIQMRAGGGSSSVDIAASAAVTAMTADTRYDYRVDFTANNGSNSTATFYRSTDSGVTWTQVGTANRTGTSVTIYQAEGYWIGSAAGAPSQVGIKIFRAQYYVGITTPYAILPERMDRWGSLGGQQVNTPVLGGSPTIFIDQAAQNGATLSANGFFTGSGSQDFAAEAWRCWTNHDHDFVSIISSHNDTDLTSVAWEAGMDTAVTNVLATAAHDPLILHMTQNPEPIDGTQDMLSRQHNARQADILQYAARNNRGCVDVHGAFVLENDPDLLLPADVHPTDAGYAFWGEIFFDCFLNGTNDTSANDKAVEFPAFMRRLPGEAEPIRKAA